MENKLENGQVENAGCDDKEKITIDEDCVGTFWLSRNISYSTGTDKMGNYYFQLVNYSTGKVYQEYLSILMI